MNKGERPSSSRAKPLRCRLAARWPAVFSLRENPENKINSRNDWSVTRA
jgi:hypothetical protein